MFYLSVIGMGSRDITVFILLSILVAGIYCLSQFNRVGNVFLDQNLEALTLSESYPSGECIYMSSHGNIALIDLFCSPDTNEYVFLECGYAYGYPTTRKGICVFE